MIAEVLPSALEGLESLDPEAACGREESFAEIFPLMGDKTAQDEIRRKTADLRHCRLLEKRPDACLRCRMNSNPYRDRNPQAVLDAIRHSELLADALELELEHRMGLLDKQDLLALTPEEIVAIQIVRDFRSHKQAKAQAEMIAAVLMQPKESSDG